MRQTWSERAKSLAKVTDHAVVGGMALAVVAAATAKLSPPFLALLLRPLSLPLVAVVGLVVGAAMVFALLARIRRDRGDVARPQPVVLRVTYLRVAAGAASEQSRTITAEVLKPDDAKALSPDQFLRGVARLNRQLTQASFVPDLLVGINGGGAAIAALLGGNEEGHVLGLAALQGAQNDRRLRDLVLPTVKHAESCKVLLVDIQLKTGHSLHLVRNALVERRRFSDDLIRVAVLVLANLRDLPTGGDSEASALDPSRIPGQKGHRTPQHYQEWLNRIRLLAFISTDSPSAPWLYWRER